MNKPLKPIEIAKQLGIKVSELLEGIENTSSDSLSKLRDSNPQKYMIQMQGIVCSKLNISIEELVKYKVLQKTIIENNKNIDNSIIYFSE